MFYIEHFINSGKNILRRTPGTSGSKIFILNHQHFPITTLSLTTDNKHHPPPHSETRHHPPKSRVTRTSQPKLPSKHLSVNNTTNKLGPIPPYSLPPPPTFPLSFPHFQDHPFFLPSPLSSFHHRGLIIPSLLSLLPSFPHLGPGPRSLPFAPPTSITPSFHHHV